MATTACACPRSEGVATAVVRSRVQIGLLGAAWSAEEADPAADWRRRHDHGVQDRPLLPGDMTMIETAMTPTTGSARPRGSGLPKI